MADHGDCSWSESLSASENDAETECSPSTTGAVSSDTSEQSQTALHYQIPESLVSSIKHVISELYHENIVAKLLRTAKETETYLPDKFPEVVPQNGPDAGKYQLRQADFWTCGFFPGSLYSLLERAIKYPQYLMLGGIEKPELRNPQITHIRQELLNSCRKWAEPLHAMADRKDTHDIGFIVMPALRLEWELLGDTRSLDTIIRAARSLATRYVHTAKAIRSWDLIRKRDIELTSVEDNLILIIDSMCNLDLMYYAAAHSEKDRRLQDIATQHATTILGTHLRPEQAPSLAKDIYQGQWYSTFHVANIDPVSGLVKQRMTAQGYADNSTWARGQAWAILGYAQTYMWTKDKKFLNASCGCAEYFIHRLENSPPCVESPDSRHLGRITRCYVPLWDFDAPINDPTNPANPLRDSSAGTIAANGLLVLSQALAALGQDTLSSRFLAVSLDIISDTLEFALSTERAMLTCTSESDVQIQDVEPGVTFDGILKFGTANNNTFARKRYANHTLVYGDYYLVEFGNRLLRMGLI